MGWQFWSQREEDILKSNYEEMTTQEMCAMLPNRSIHGVTSKLDNMPLRPGYRTCRYCNCTFTPLRRSQIYCCTKCKGLKYREKELAKSEVVIQSANRT